MIRVLSTAALAALLVYLGLCALLFLFQRSLIYFPQPRSPAARTELLTLAVGDVAVNVTALHSSGASALLYFGGNAEDATFSLPELAEAFPGRSIFLLHYRSYGGSTGEPSEAALVGDAMALFDRLRPKYQDIAVVGRSLGSGVAVQLAGQRPVSRLVLVTPFDSLQEVAAFHFPYFPVRWLLRDRFESWKHAEKISAPTLVIAAEHDEVIPGASTERLVAHFRPGIASFRIVGNTGHNTIGENPDYLAWLKSSP